MVIIAVAAIAVAVAVAVSLSSWLRASGFGGLMATKIRGMT